MRKTSIVIGVLFVLAFSFGTFGVQNGYDLFQKALAKERAEGNLEEAIALYQQVIKEAKDKALAAKAQLRIGICFEKLGEEKEKQAQKAYQMVIDNYPQQIESVKVAKEKLSNLIRIQAVSKKDLKEFNIRRIWESPKLGRGNLGEVSPDGRYLSLSDIEGKIAAYEFATQKRQFITDAFFTGKKKGTSENSAETFIKGDFPVWSPDGKQIAFNRKKYSELCVLGSNKAGPIVLYKSKDDEQVIPVDWSSDGNTILAALAKKYAAFQAVLISVPDGSVRILKTYEKPPRSEPRRLGIFSPDGRYIAGDFEPQGESRSRDIFVLSADGSSEVPVVAHPDDDLALGWSPDGKKLVFASDRSGTWDIWAIEIIEGQTQGGPKMIKSDIGAVWPLGFTEKGSFYYLLERGLMDIYTASLDIENKTLSDPEKATQRFLGRNVFPEWSPDGNFLSYVSQRDAGYDRLATKSPVCILSTETGAEHEIVPELRYIWGTSWSPDGKSILAVGSEEEGKEGFYKIDPQTGTVTSILQFNSGDRLSEPEWSHDGSKIYFTHKQTTQEEARIIAYDFETKGKKEIYRGEFNPSYIVGRNAFFAHELALSQDGKSLAFNKGWSPVLMVVPTDGGEAREVWRMKKRGEQISTIDWMPDGKELIFVSYQLPDRTIDETWRIAVDGGEPQKLGLSMERMHWLSVHPGGQKVVFSSIQRIKDVWMMENFLPAEDKGSKGGQR
jgi:Tol biopolymer transport system component